MSGSDHAGMDEKGSEPAAPRDACDERNVESHGVEVILPLLLTRLSGTGSSVRLDVEPPITMTRVIDALEATYPSLSGTTRNRDTGRRRDYLRLFACGEDWSDRGMDEPLPEAVAKGGEPLMIVGAMSGG